MHCRGSAPEASGPKGLSSATVVVRPKGRTSCNPILDSLASFAAHVPARSDPFRSIHSMKSDFPARGKKFHCVRGKFMFPCHNPGIAWDNAGRRAKTEHESDRGEAATGHEEILESEPLFL